MKVPQDRHCAQGQSSGFSFAMQIIPGIEHSILMIHQAIYGVGRAMGSRMIVSRRIARTLAPELEDHFLQVPGKLLSRPFTQAAQALRELSVRLGIGTVPDAIEHLLPQSSRATFDDFQDAVQETQ